MGSRGVQVQNEAGSCPAFSSSSMPLIYRKALSLAFASAAAGVPVSTPFIIL